MRGDTADAGGTLLKRFHAVLAGVTAGDLSRVDCAVLGWLAEYAGGDRLEAWPALETLSRAAGVSVRQVSRSIARLRRLGYVEVTVPGTRMGRSTRHRLTSKGAADIAMRKVVASARRQTEANDGGDTADTTGTDNADTTVVTSWVEGGDKTVPEVVTTLSPKPPMNRAAKRGSMDVVVGLPSASHPAAPAAVATGSPGGDRPSAARTPGKLDHPWFGATYPKRVNAAEADRLLTELLEKGASKAAIEAGVQVYADHVRRKHLSDKYISAPLNWLKGERWVDRFNDSEPTGQSESKQQKAPGKASERAQGARSTGGKDIAATKPTKAGKPRQEESPEKREQRLSAAKAKKLQRAAEREAAMKARAEREQAELEFAMASRDEVVARLVAAGMNRDSLHNRIVNTIEKSGKLVPGTDTSGMRDALRLAIAHGEQGYNFPSRLIDWFGSSGAARQLLNWLPKVIERFNQDQVRRQQEERQRVADERARAEAARAELSRQNQLLCKYVCDLEIEAPPSDIIEDRLERALQAMRTRLDGISCADAAETLAYGGDSEIAAQLRFGSIDAIDIGDVEKLSKAIERIVAGVDERR